MPVCIRGGAFDFDCYSPTLVIPDNTRFKIPTFTLARIAGRVMMMMLGAMVPRPGYWRVCSGCAASDSKILFPV